MERLSPSVSKPRPRLRLGFVVALLLAMAAGLITLLVRPFSHGAPPRQDLRARCTPLEVETTIHKLDVPHQAVCLAIAGKIDRARTLLLGLEPVPRNVAVGDLFSIAHPIADAWDDVSAGPIMGLVVEFQPNNYMAMFHAGMANAALGHDELARTQLERFLGMYSPEDIWRTRAKNALAAIDAHVPVQQREVHFAE